MVLPKGLQTRFLKCKSEKIQTLNSSETILLRAAKRLKRLLQPSTGEELRLAGIDSSWKIYSKSLTFVQNFNIMALHESFQPEVLDVHPDLDVRSDYEIERNKPMPSLNHSSIQSNLIMELTPFRNQFRITSELSLALPNWPSIPDICIYPKMPINLRKDVISMTEPPLCAIEIISPSQSVDEMREKAEKYFLHGVKSCWIVIPAFANIYVYSSLDEYEIYRAHETLKDTVLGISIPLKEVFE